MSDFDSALQQAVQTIPECLAAGYVDLESGMLIGIKTVDSHPDEVMDMLAAATAEMFQGPNVVAIERIFKKARGVEDDGSHYFQEMIVNSDNLIHFFMRAKSSADQVACFVCRRSANLGMVVTKARQAMSAVEAAA
ncbi:MAG: hypothetical protein V2J19_00955 [Wenzhouxiangella sp.]|jgi:hypothetical protein|nr:hypothetical protein [Wenzhouxiangella sp.]